jgi:hypothetical protein
MEQKILWNNYKANKQTLYLFVFQALTPNIYLITILSENTSTPFARISIK